MNLYDSEFYMENVQYVAGLDLPWEKLDNKSVMLPGATGMLGSFLVDVLMERSNSGNDITVHTLGRSEERARERFSKHQNNDYFIFIPYDVKEPLDREDFGIIDFILHLSSNTHPMQYSINLIGTITTK